MPVKEVKIGTEFIKLDAFLKWAAIVSMGSEAKMIIQNGEVTVNGEVETRRGRKLVKGDKVEFEEKIYTIV